jgi:hypothetical protein
MAPNTAGDPLELDPVIHRNEEGVVVVPDLQELTPSGLKMPSSDPSEELSEQRRVEPGLPGIFDPAG